MSRVLRCVIALGLLVAGACAQAQGTVVAYNTYLTAPFSADQNPGLAAELVEYLNAKLKGRYVVSLQNLPRERLNQKVIADLNFKGIVLFSNPIFVADVDKKKYFWTAPIMSDRNNVISPTSKKIEYRDPDSLKDKLFAGIRGNKYAGLEGRFGKDIKRADFNSELTMLKTIAMERAEVTLMAASTYNYLMNTCGQKEGLIGKLYVSPTPHLRFDRYMFVANSDEALAKALSTVAEGMAGDPEWQAILAKYGALNPEQVAKPEQ